MSSFLAIYGLQCGLMRLCIALQICLRIVGVTGCFMLRGIGRGDFCDLAIPCIRNGPERFGPIRMTFRRSMLN